MTVGLIAAFASAACYEAGYVLQTLEARTAPREHALRASLLTGLASQPRWLGGTVLSIAGAALQVFALAHAPVTLVQPVLALGLVGLLLFARSALHERVGTTQVLGSALVVAGVVTVGIEGPKATHHVTSTTALVLLLAPLGALVLAPFLLRGGRIRLRLAAFGAAAGDALAAVGLKLTADATLLDRWGLAVAAVAGAVAAGALALTAEMSSLRAIPATQVAPVVLAAQVIVPAIAAIAAFGEPLTAAVALGVIAAGAGAALLGASGGIAKLRAGREAERVADDGRGARQRGERVVR